MNDQLDRRGHEVDRCTRRLRRPTRRANASVRPGPGAQRSGDVGYDAGDHEGLRLALRAVDAQGWESSAGRTIVAELQRRSRPWACLTDRRCGRPPGTTEPADVVAVAWLTLQKSPTKVALTQRPWAYLWTVVGNELARAATAESRMTEPSRLRGHTPGPAVVIRVGLESEALDAALPPADESAPDCDASPQVQELARRLSAVDDDIPFWLDAIGRALDVMSEARRSYEEYRLRRDAYMREELGLSLDELSALAALLIGPRKGDRAAQSLLLALHRNVDIPTDQVVGAPARIRLLRKRRLGSAVSPSAA